MILTLDVGTTAIKVCLFNKELVLLDKTSEEYNLITEDGYIELEPDDYWKAICSAIGVLGGKNNISDVKAICITTQGETIIPVDKDGKKLHRAVVWLDDRAGDQAETILSHRTQDEIFETTGVPDMNGAVPLAKLLWFREKKPEIYQNTYKFLLLEDYLIYRFTGEFVTEKSLLTSTAWYDIYNDTYWTDLLETLNLDQNKLPQILDCGQEAGLILPEVASELGLAEDVKIITGAMDQIAAAIGGGGLNAGIVTATIGTAMAITSLLPSAKNYKNTAMPVYRGVTEGQYVVIPYSPTSGAVFKWFKDEFCKEEIEYSKNNNINIYDYLCSIAKDVPAGANGVIMFPYFAGCIQPEPIPDARGVIFGLGLDADKKTIIKSILESVGYMIRENIEMLKSMGIDIKKLHFFGGGSKNPYWNQIIADILGIELVLLEQSECASQGAAILAAVSLGWASDIQEAQKSNPVSGIIKPDIKNKHIYDEMYSKYIKLIKAVQPLFA